jgi:uncharacterized protein (TIGR02594 family)
MRPKYIEEAYKLLGLKEGAGKLNNKDVLDLYADAGHPEVKNDEVPWCAAFVGACLARANKPSTGTLLARDYLNYGKRLGKKPEMFAIGVMSRGNSSWEGHVGYVVKFDAERVWLLGGNQNNSVSVVSYPRSRFLGFTKPEEKEVDKSSKEITNDSRRLKTQTWLERAYAVGAAAFTAVCTYYNEALALLRDNAGVVILSVIALGWLSLRLLKSMSIREYREGRYQPKKQWE